MTDTPPNVVQLRPLGDGHILGKLPGALDESLVVHMERVEEDPAVTIGYWKASPDEPGVFNQLAGGLDLHLSDLRPLIDLLAASEVQGRAILEAAGRLR